MKAKYIFRHIRAEIICHQESCTYANVERSSFRQTENLYQMKVWMYTKEWRVLEIIDMWIIIIFLLIKSHWKISELWKEK